MEQILFEMAVRYAQSKVKSKNLFCVVFKIEGCGLCELFQASSEEEFKKFLFFNRGEYFIVYKDIFGFAASISPFEKGLCLN